MTTKIHLLLASVCILISGCTTTDKKKDLTPEDRIIEEYSQGEDVYKGFYNNFSFKATLLNTPVMKALHEKMATFYSWNSTQRQTEWANFQTKAQNETEVFVSFYAPEARDDNLDQKNSIWKVYLDVNGQRYEGKPKKDRRQPTEVFGLFHYHTRWNTPYIVAFPVGLTLVEGQNSTLTVTGPLGTKTVQFTVLK